MATVASSTGEPANAFHQIAPSSSTLTNTAPCDVFINHRGSDVKRNLASSIYHTLHLMGVTAFLDVEVLELGDSIPAQIQAAIQISSLHIAIFSQNYAQSPWCLAELSFMLETNTKIIPIFYHVDPSDLRWIKGTYAEAFSQHEKSGRYSAQHLEEWKMALHKVSFLSGYILNNINDDEGMLLKSVVNYVTKEIEKDLPLVVAKHPVGLEETVKDFERRTIEPSQNVQIVGIVGMGGSGKTTLAKELYNRKCLSVERCSFIFEVRDAAARKVLHKKQQKLLEDLRVKGSALDSIEEGKGILAKHFRSRSVLIVLDDVDHVEQLDALLPVKDSLGCGSLIIVTTREMGVLTSSDISSVYKMPGLNREHSMELFCWHAFLQPCSLQGYEDLVEKFLNVCNGLPLSLRVLGGQLYRKSKDYWESQYHKICRILPKDIKESLKASYDALDPEEQEIFLDIACFFIGEEKSLAIAAWEGSGWSGVHSWETLVNKCLVDLDFHNHIRMHDHLRDLGREIASAQSPYRIWSPKHIWSPQHIFKIQQQQKERMMIRGIDLESLEEGFPELIGNSSSELYRLLRSSRGLEILIVRGNTFNKEFARLSQGIVWLRWNCFQHRNLPSWLSLRNLRVLELSEAVKLEELWEEANTNPPLQLRELIITSANSLQRFPTSIGCLKHLKKIALNGRGTGNTRITSLPKEFCGLQSLEHLDLSDCQMLSSLPTSFGNLTNLRLINLGRCEELKMLPVSFKQLIHLEHLDLSYCEKLRFRLDMLENVTKLQYVNFSSCQKLIELPRHITYQAFLRELYLSDTSVRDVPANIDRLRKLEHLEIGSPFLTSLPSSLGNLTCLTELKISCQKLESLPDSLGHLNVLEELDISNSAVKCLPGGVWQLPHLQIFTVLECPLGELAFGSPSFSSSMCKLRVISLTSTNVSKISISEEHCPNLETLSVFVNNHLREIEALQKQ